MAVAGALKVLWCRSGGVISTNTTQPNSSFWKILNRLLLVCCGLRVLTALLQIFLPLDQPHIWRQSDTIGVALRWVRRVTVEAPSDSPIWLPAVLNSADVNGIMPMEFPFFNAFLSLGYWGGSFPASLWRVKLVTLIWHLGLWFWVMRSWRSIHLGSIRMDRAWLLLPFASLSALFFPKMIPDVTAVFLCLIATAYLIRAQNIRHHLLTFLLGALGLLIKPTAVITFAVALTK